MKEPAWSEALKKVLDEGSQDGSIRLVTLRLADYDPARAAEIERDCTLTEIAEAATVKRHDDDCEVEVD